MGSPLLKLCGNKSLSDLKISNQSHAQFVGVIFAKESRRCVDPNILARWLKEIDNFRQRLVGVFINPTINDLLEVLVKVKLDVIQCHGSESPQEVLKLKQVIQLPIWKVIHHQDDALALMKTYNGVVDGYIIDNKRGNELGGTGESFDWSFIPKYIEEAHRQGVKCFIAGGINSENIEKLLIYDPDGIDISSGIEKNFAKNRQLVNQIEEKVANVYGDGS